MNGASGCLLIVVLWLVLCGCLYGSNDPYEEALRSLNKNYDQIVRSLSRIPDTVWAAPHLRYNPSSQRNNHTLSPSTPFIKDGVSNYTCYGDILHIILNAKQMWAIQIFDASGKLPPGVLQGGLKWVGSYDECIGISVPLNESTGLGGFGGQYCTLDMSTSLQQISMPISLGICIPDSCNAYDLEENIHEIFKFIDNMTWIKPMSKLSKYVDINKVTCQPKSKDLSSAAIGYLFILSICGLLILLGSLFSIYEYLLPSISLMNKHDQAALEREENGRIQALFKLDGTHSTNGITDVGNGTSIAVGVQNDDGENTMLTSEPYVTISDHHSHSLITSIGNFLKCFSVFSNGAKILSTKNTGNQLSCLHGIRVLSMTWVILGHTYLFPLELYNNLLEVLQILDTWTFQVVARGFVSVDSFFVLSGFLLTWLFLNEADKKQGKINWVMFYVHRFWRLTPVYMLVMGFYATIASDIGKGPFAGDIGDAVICEKTWWWNLLYINNFVYYDGMCMGWMWYIANDMQFYVISPIFLYALWRKPKIGFCIISALVLICWICSASITAVRDLPPILSGLTGASLNTTDFQQKMADAFEFLYIKPYIRIGPYLAGVVVGYLFYKTGDRRNFLTWWQQVLAWACASYLALSVIYGLYHVEMTRGLAITYNTFSSTAWGISLGWVIYACLTGHADFINAILSWSGWIPISRLTYCAYLIHPIVMHVFTKSFQSTIYVTQPTIIGYFSTFLLWTYGLSFLVSVAFEAPAMALEKLAQKKKQS